MGWARNTTNLLVVNVEHVLSFAGYERSDIPAMGKICSFHSFENVDLTGLSNMGKVFLNNSSSFGSEADPTQLSNIGDLEIRLCWNYFSTRNIYHIRQRLCIDHCKRLRKLEGLQGIPNIMLGSLPVVDDIKGLGNNNLVAVFKVPYLIECAKKYRRVRNDIHLKAELPYADIFDTIKAFFVILDHDDYQYECGDEDDSNEDDEDEDEDEDGNEETDELTEMQKIVWEQWKKEDKEEENRDEDSDDPDEHKGEG